MRHILVLNETGLHPQEMPFTLPWQEDAHALNFRSPQEILSVNAFYSIKNPLDVESLIIVEGLLDYACLVKFVNLRELYIYNGRALEYVSFVREMKYLSQLYIKESSITNLSPLKTLLDTKERLIDEAPTYAEKYRYMMDGIAINSIKEIDGRALTKSPAISEVIINDDVLCGGE